MAIETVDVSKSNLNLTTTRTPSSELGKDDFLKLLTQQLKNQDPMNPMDDTEFIGQMTTFSSLEQMVNMNKSLETMISAYNSSSQTQAMMFLGTTVTAQTAEMNEAVTGVVDMVGFKDGTPYLRVGEYAFSVSDVQLASPTIYNV